MTHSTQAAMVLIYNRPILESPIGRRKARVECRWCKRAVIATKWICMECYMGLPLNIRKSLNNLYRLSKVVGKRHPQLLLDWREKIGEAFNYLEDKKGN